MIFLFAGDCLSLMERYCGSWFPHQHPGWHSPNLNTLSAPLEVELEQQHAISAYMNHCPNLVPSSGSSAAHAFSVLPHSRPCPANEPHGWFYCLPRYRQAFSYASTPILKEKLPVVGPYGNSRVVNPPDIISECPQKRFLVFDQSGDQTTLVFSSVIGAPGQCLTSWGPKPCGAHDLSGGEERAKGDQLYQQGLILSDYSNENGGTDVHSEMHEDTEELNALLYSDDEYSNSEDDEEISTGHSPSTMTVYDRQDWQEGKAEEVASSDGSNKRRKLLNGEFNVPSLMDTASSAKPDKFLEFEDDALSSCAEGNNPEPGEIRSLSGNKRLRKDRIRETVNILQCLIPGGKGKDAIVVLDEAINYLKSLKLKAKALGLDTP